MSEQCLTELPGVVFGGLRDHKDREFRSFEVRRHEAYGPGWYVFGRWTENPRVLVRMMARPDVPRRAHVHYNCKVHRGWLTKHEAQAIADRLNELFPVGVMCEAC